MSSLSAWERGQTRPGGSSGDRLTILANLYHVDPDSLDPDAFPKAEKMTKPKLPVTKAVKVEAEARPVENGLFLKGVQVEPVAGGRMLIRFEAVVSAKDSQGFVAQLLQVAANAAVGK